MGTEVYVILSTPFYPDGGIDYASFDRLVEHCVQAGATGLTVLGQMGEAPKLEHAESVAILRRLCSRVDVPVVVGVTAPGFAAMRALTREATDAGAAGVMIAPPTNLRTDDQIVTYYRQASDAIGTEVPIVVQDYPLTFTVQMTPRVIRRIADEVEGVYMLKHEDWPGLEKISALRALEASARGPLRILTGNGALFLDFEMERGADGAMTGYSFPELLTGVVRLSAEGRRDEAHDLFDAHLPLIRYEQQQGVGLAVRKYILMRRGLLDSDAQRTPAGALSATARQEVDYLLDRLARADSGVRLSR
ncbi:dihydrodipicolinate synthase family protein [Dactylosporangium sp. CS-033363]|uniref:dihydrodipicolinate synthase family protein n=1 Tax=Dactylosporangium sp. CS-033363 TaxID=3239935 RepID=UPI003D8C6ACA